MSGSSKKVDRERRTSEVMYQRRDLVAGNIIYYGRTDDFDAADSDSVWQIWRVVLDGTIETTTYANFGKYNCRWSDRASYFTAEPSPAPYPAVNVNVYPSGLRYGGKITAVTLASGVWTPLPATALVNRNALGIQNQSGSEIKINYDNTTVGYVGVKVAAGSERYYDITDDIVVYAMPFAGSPTIIVEEIS